MSALTPAGSSGTTQTVIPAPVGTPTSIFSQVLAVASGSSATVLTRTVPAGVSDYLLHLTVGGTNIATYDVTVNGSPYARLRTHWGEGMTITEFFGTSLQDAPKLATGTVITVTVTNFRPSSGDFEARLQFIEV